MLLFVHHVPLTPCLHSMTHPSHSTITSVPAAACVPSSQRLPFQICIRFLYLCLTSIGMMMMVMMMAAMAHYLTTRLAGQATTDGGGMSGKH